MTENTQALNLSAETKIIKKISVNAQACITEANTAAMRYGDFGLATGNLDLLRMLREALSHKALQAKLDTWLKTCFPIKRVSKKSPSGNVTVTYQKDKKRTRREGWKVLDEIAYSMGPMGFKKPKVTKDEPTLAEVLDMLSKSLDRIAGKVPDESGDVALTLRMAIEELATEAEEQLEKITKSNKKPEPTQAELIKAVKDAAEIAA